MINSLISVYNNKEIQQLYGGLFNTDNHGVNFSTRLAIFANYYYMQMKKFKQRFINQTVCILLAQISCSIIIFYYLDYIIQDEYLSSFFLLIFFFVGYLYFYYIYLIVTYCISCVCQ